MRMPAPWCVANEPRQGQGATLLADWKERMARSKDIMEGSNPHDLGGFEAMDADEVAAPPQIQARVMSRIPTPAATPEMVARDVREAHDSIAAMVGKAL